MNLLRLFRQSDRSTHAFQVHRRRPLVEDLEGRQLLSGFAVTAGIQGAHIGVAAAVQGAHIGSAAAIQGAHIGSAAAIQGAHIG